MGATVGGSCLFLVGNLVQRCNSASVGTWHREVAVGPSGNCLVEERRGLFGFVGAFEDNVAPCNKNG